MAQDPANSNQLPKNITIQPSTSLGDLFSELIEKLYNNGNAPDGVSLSTKIFANITGDSIRVDYEAGFDKNARKIGADQIQYLLGQALNILLGTHSGTVAKLPPIEVNHRNALLSVQSLLSTYKETYNLEIHKQAIQIIYNVLLQHVKPTAQEKKPENYKRVLGKIASQISSNQLAEAWGKNLEIDSLSYFINKLIGVAQQNSNASFLNIRVDDVSVLEVKELASNFAIKHADTLKKLKLKKEKKEELNNDEQRWLKTLESFDENDSQKYINPNSLTFAETPDKFTPGTEVASTADATKLRQLLDLYQKFFIKLDETKIAPEPTAAAEDTETEDADAEQEEVIEKPKKVDEIIENLIQRIKLAVAEELANIPGELKRLYASSIHPQIDQFFATTLEEVVRSAVSQADLKSKIELEVIPGSDPKILLYDEDLGGLINTPQTQEYITSLVESITKDIVKTQTDNNLLFSRVKALLDEKSTTPKRPPSSQEMNAKQFQAQLRQFFELNLRQDIPGMPQLIELGNSSLSSSQLVLQTISAITSEISRIVKSDPNFNFINYRTELIQHLSKDPYRFYDPETKHFWYDQRVEDWLDTLYRDGLKSKILGSTAIARLVPQITNALGVTEQPATTELTEDQKSAQLAKVVADIDNSQTSIEAALNTEFSITSTSFQVRQEQVRLQQLALIQFMAAQGLDPNLFGNDASLLHEFINDSLQDILQSLSPEELADLTNPATRLKMMRKLYFRLRSNSRFIAAFDKLALQYNLDRTQLDKPNQEVMEKLEAQNLELQIDGKLEVSSDFNQNNYISQINTAFSALFADPQTKTRQLNNFYNTVDSFITLNYSTNFIDGLTPDRFNLIFGFKPTPTQLIYLRKIIKSYWKVRKEQIINQYNQNKTGKDTDEANAAELLGNEEKTFSENPRHTQTRKENEFKSFVRPVYYIRSQGATDALDATYLDDDQISRMDDQRRQKIDFIKRKLIMDMIQAAAEEDRAAMAYQLGVENDIASLQVYSVQPPAQRQASSAAALINKSQGKVLANPRKKPGFFRKNAKRVPGLKNIIGLGDDLKKSGSDLLSKGLETAIAEGGTIAIETGLDIIAPGLGRITGALLRLLPKKVRKYLFTFLLAGIAAFIYKTFQLFASTWGGFVGGLAGGIGGGVAGFLAGGPAGAFVGAGSGWTAGAYFGYGIQEGLGISGGPSDLFGGGQKPPTRPQDLQIESAKTLPKGTFANFGSAPVIGMTTVGTLTLLSSSALMTAHLSNIPTGTGLDRGESKYVQIQKVISETEEIEDPEFPLEVAYQVAIAPKVKEPDETNPDGIEYTVVIDTSTFTDTISVRTNSEAREGLNLPEPDVTGMVRDFNAMLTSNCSSYGDTPDEIQGDQLKNLLKDKGILSQDEKTITISKSILKNATEDGEESIEKLIFPPYCETFGEEFIHSKITNTVEFGITVEDPEEASTVTDTVSGALSLCLGECPSGLGEGCWPVHGTFVQESYGQEYCSYQASKYADAPWSHCNGGKLGGGYYPDAFDIGTNKKNYSIHSIESGTIITTSSQENDSYGFYTIVEGDSGTQVLYAHMISPGNFSSGEKVNKGDILGDVGNTGASTSEHLHFEIRRAATPNRFGYPVGTFGDPDSKSLLRNIYMKEISPGNYERFHGGGITKLISQQEVCQ